MGCMYVLKASFNKTHVRYIIYREWNNWPKQHICLILHWCFEIIVLKWNNVFKHLYKIIIKILT